MCYFCLVNAGYESGSWIGVLRDQTHIMLTTVELTLALKLRGHFSYPLSYAFSDSLPPLSFITFNF